MRGLQIIEAIQRLPREERLKVIKFARENLEEGQLSGEELGELTCQMVEAKEPADAVRLKEQIVQGFYGKAPHA